LWLRALRCFAPGLQPSTSLTRLSRGDQSRGIARTINFAQVGGPLRDFTVPPPLFPARRRDCTPASHPARHALRKRPAMWPVISRVARRCAGRVRPGHSKRQQRPDQRLHRHSRPGSDRTFRPRPRSIRFASTVGLAGSWRPRSPPGKTPARDWFSISASPGKSRERGVWMRLATCADGAHATTTPPNASKLAPTSKRGLLHKLQTIVNWGPIIRRNGMRLDKRRGGAEGIPREVPGLL